MSKRFKMVCRGCMCRYEEGDESDDNYATGLCYYCFEDAVEAAEELRLRRIQEANEY